MVKVEITEKDKKLLNYERYHHPHPRVQRKMEVLWLKSQDESHQRIAQLTGVSVNRVTQYIKDYAAGGIEKLKEFNVYRHQSELVAHHQTIEEHFRQHPPATIKEAMATIESLTGIKRSEMAVAKFLNKIGIKRRKVGMIPAKADINKQEAFKKKVSNLVLKKPKKKNELCFLLMLLILCYNLSWDIYGALQGYL